MSAGENRRSFAPFASPDFRLLWAGTALAFLAFVIAMVTQAIIAYDLAGKNRAVGIVAQCSGIALALGSPIGGVIADRVEKRRLLLLSQAGVAALFAVLGTLVIADVLTLPLLAVLVFVTSLASCAILPARQAMAPATLPAEQAGDGAALLALAVTLVGLAGPFVGGVLVAILGAGGAYLALAAVMVAAMLLVVVTRTPGPPQSEGSRPIEDLRFGLAHVFGRPRLAVLMLAFYGLILAGSSYAILLPGFLEDRLGREASQTTWLMTMSGAGGLVATGLISLLPGLRQTATLLGAGGLILGVGLALVGSSGSFPVAMGCMLIVGVGIATVQLVATALIMRESDPAFYGRVMSLVMLSWGLNGLAALGLGLLADAMSAGRTLALMGAVAVAVSVVMWAVLRGLRSGGDAPAGARSSSAPS